MQYLCVKCPSIRQLLHSLAKLYAFRYLTFGPRPPIFCVKVVILYIYILYLCFSCNSTLVETSEADNRNEIDDILNGTNIKPNPIIFPGEHLEVGHHHWLVDWLVG